MARRDDDPASATTSFFIVTAEAASLDGKYSAFGKVESGLDVVEKIEAVAVNGEEPQQRVELRKVKLVYRCAVCGTEVRMTMANDEVPDPPRHCMDEMELVTPVDDL